MGRTAPLFRTVPAQHHLGFWTEQALNAKKVAEFYDFDKREIAKVANVAPSSVRYDHKIPKEVAERLAEIANIAELAAQFFAGDSIKTALWFKTPNPLLGQICPRDMVRYGRYDRLRQFVLEALRESAAEAAVPESLTSVIDATTHATATA